MSAPTTTTVGAPPAVRHRPYQWRERERTLVSIHSSDSRRKLGFFLSLAIDTVGAGLPVVLQQLLSSELTFYTSD
ncbi:hypothetical protein HAX54_004632 [Datura stramonium]|uniref:MFS transporter n=1 Tax=Datura stramonium TaxID=4076 RepID=A0ABS8T7B3_DATST|nr:hypothetical protein [Datura stramonium]